MDTSAVSKENSWALLSNTMVTSAAFFGFLPSAPEKMISSVFCPRRLWTFCSPKTQRTASEILLFPQPFGPTITVIPSANSIVVLSAKDLNPCKINRSNFINPAPRPGLYFYYYTGNTCFLPQSLSLTPHGNIRRKIKPPPEYGDSTIFIMLFPFAAGKRIPWSALQAARERFFFQFLLYIPSNSHQRLRPDGTAQ